MKRSGVRGRETRSLGSARERMNSRRGYRNLRIIRGSSARRASASKCGFRRCDPVKAPYAVPAILQCNFPSRITEANNSPLAGTFSVFCLALISEATSVSSRDPAARCISYGRLFLPTRSHAFYRDAILVDRVRDARYGAFVP